MSSSSKTPLLIYTHSDCQFLWVTVIGQIQKYVKGLEVHFAYNDSFEDIEKYQIPKEWKIHTYDATNLWTERVNSVLNKIDSKHILYIQEDWIPTGQVTESVINDMTQWMNTKDADFLLSYAHVSIVTSQVGEETGYPEYRYYKENNHILQPAIWKMSTFKEFTGVFKKAVNQGEDQETLNFMSSKNCYSVQNYNTVTSFRTTNSLMFPHMHALTQGQWNFLKYPSLKNILDEYGVDTNSRGTNNWWEIDTQ